MPSGDRIRTIVAYAHESYSEHEGGQVADYIPQLANADPSMFGITVADASGGLYSAGDADVEFSIQSIRRQQATAHLSRALGLNVFASNVDSARSNGDD
ncbi:glutaminase [Gordonia sp. HY002]|uniref:glutaminase n=1 Tax=Gordonia zhenghanii TaxID=2911516 RepID=UPI001EF0BDA1|nr:glutaminase [Gordonia zhenghanii]MCF8572104.1 glutaminase [Gordonia zhenghanii]MCF8602978.1 glutaminase [Gordonia zhenghanii]